MFTCAQSRTRVDFDVLRLRRSFENQLEERILIKSNHSSFHLIINNSLSNAGKHLLRKLIHISHRRTKKVGQMTYKKVTKVECRFGSPRRSNRKNISVPVHIALFFVYYRPSTCRGPCKDGRLSRLRDTSLNTLMEKCVKQVHAGITRERRKEHTHTLTGVTRQNGLLWFFRNILNRENTWLTFTVWIFVTSVVAVLFGIAKSAWVNATTIRTYEAVAGAEHNFNKKRQRKLFLIIEKLKYSWENWEGARGQQSDRQTKNAWKKSTENIEVTCGFRWSVKF